MRFGSSTNHLPILRVLSGPTTHSRECPFGARNSISPSPTVSIANASMNLLFHTVLFSRFSGASRTCWLYFIVTLLGKLVRKRNADSTTVVRGTREGEV
jgi:hypothetical protein